MSDFKFVEVALVMGFQDLIVKLLVVAEMLALLKVTSHCSVRTVLHLSRAFSILFSFFLYIFKQGASIDFFDFCLCERHVGYYHSL